MIRNLLLFTTSLFLLACSNDDGNSQPEEQATLKIKKLSKTLYNEDGISTISKSDYLFDETGKMTKWLQDYFNQNILLYDDFLYNDLGQIIESKTTDVHQNRVTRTINYEYDSSNRISNVIYTSDNGAINISHFSYENNIVSIQDDIGGSKKLTFNEDGKLRKTISHDENLNHTVTETITYTGDLVNSIHYDYTANSSSTEDYVYEYDTKTNPLFKNFQENIDNYIYNFNGNMKSFKSHFSTYNFTKVKFTSSLPDPHENYTEVFTTQYNQQGFPISIEVKRNDVLFEELTYEYY